MTKAERARKDRKREASLLQQILEAARNPKIQVVASASVQNDRESTLLRQTYEKLQVIFIAVRNLDVEVKNLRAEQSKLRSVILALLSDPRAREDFMSVLHDFGVNEGSQVKNHHR